jgi:hypothetical protein
MATAMITSGAIAAIVLLCVLLGFVFAIYYAYQVFFCVFVFTLARFWF